MAELPVIFPCTFYQHYPYCQSSDKYHTMSLNNNTIIYNTNNVLADRASIRVKVKKNVWDRSRTSPNSRILTDFITDFNLLPCIDLAQSNVPYIHFIDRSNNSIAHYQWNLDDHLNNMYIDDQLLHCKDINCIRHKRDMSMCYDQLIDVCSCASDSIPTTYSRSHCSKPGWNDNIKYLRDDALSWHYSGKLIVVPELDIMRRWDDWVDPGTIELFVI